MRFDDGTTESIALGPSECRQFFIQDLFGGSYREDIHSAEIENGQGVVAIELFGNGRQLSGVPLNDSLSDLIYYPHIASDEQWETGLVAYNPEDAPCLLTITTYTETGVFLAEEIVDIAAKGRYFGTASGLGLPKGAAWMKLQAQYPVAGFELFTNRNGDQLAGYTGIDLAKSEGVLPLLEKDGATGVAFVNMEADEGTIVVTAFNNIGFAIDETTLVLNAFEKRVAVIKNLFEKNISAATFIHYASNKDMVIFQLNGSSDRMMLDALPGL